MYHVHVKFNGESVFQHLAGIYVTIEEAEKATAEWNEEHSDSEASITFTTSSPAFLMV